jgi:hypothetical protein
MTDSSRFDVRLRASFCTELLLSPVNLRRGTSKLVTGALSLRAPSNSSFLVGVLLRASFYKELDLSLFATNRLFLGTLFFIPRVTVAPIAIDVGIGTLLYASGRLTLTQISRERVYRVHCFAVPIRRHFITPTAPTEV